MTPLIDVNHFRLGASVLATLVMLGAGARVGEAQRLPCAENSPTASFLTAASDIEYACGYLLKSRPPQHAMAASNLRLALDKEPDNADARLLMVVALSASGSLAEAPEAMAAAERADPRARERLNQFLALHPALRPQEADPNEAPPAGGPPRTRSPGTRVDPSPADNRRSQQTAFKVGDRVEVMYAHDQWTSGVVVRANPGGCATYTVRYDAYGNGPAELVFFCGSVRAPTGRVDGPPRPKLGGPLALGTYTCDDRAAFGTQRRARGSITLKSGGVYAYLRNGGSGRYRYDAASGVITWVTGPLRSQSPESTTFRRNRTTAQIDILFTGVYGWSCGRNL